MLEAQIGEHIESFVKRLVGIAQKKEVSGVFNGIMLKATKESSVEELMKAYDEGFEAYLNSPEVIKKTREQEERMAISVAENQKILDAAMVEFETVNVLDAESTLKILKTMIGPMDFIGVEKKPNVILSKFEAAGFCVDMCTGKDYNDDQETQYKYIIGQIMAGIEKYGAPHPVAERFIDGWLNNFGSNK